MAPPSSSIAGDETTAGKPKVEDRPTTASLLPESPASSSENIKAPPTASPVRNGVTSMVNDLFSSYHAEPQPPVEGFVDEEEDEEEEDDDDYDEYGDEDSTMGYSDDSSSLNDSYFRPQPGDNLARPWSGSGRLVYGSSSSSHHPPSSSNNAAAQSFNYPTTTNNPYLPNTSHNAPATMAASYGSTNTLLSRESSNGSLLGGPLLLLGGPIQEDSEATMDDPPSHLHLHHHAQHPHGSSIHSSLSSSGGREDEHSEATALLRHHQQQQQHQHHYPPASPQHKASPAGGGKRRRSRKGSSRPKLHPRLHPKVQQAQSQQPPPQQQSPSQTQPVFSTEPQQPLDGTWRDSFWAGLFLVHLLVVCLCALRFGLGVILVRESWTTVVPATKTNSAAAETYAAAQQDQNDDGVRRLVDQLRDVTVPAPFLRRTSSTTTTTTTHTTDDDVSIVPQNATLSDILFSNDDKFLIHKSNDDDAVVTNDDASSTEEDSTKTDSTEDDGNFTIDYKNVLAITFFAGFYACILSYISFGFMLILARSLIIIMLIFSILVSLAWGLIGLTADPYGVIALMGFAALLSTLGYTMYSWNRIPFAATNLYTALTAMRCTADITILGLLSLVVAFGWCLLWSMAFIGIVNDHNDKDCDTKDACQAHVSRNHIPLYLLLLLSFHWTTMVIKNVVRVTVASAISTWWFQPSDIGPFCTSAVVRPLLRSLSTSLGSICLGSLIISPAQWLLSFGRFFCSCLCIDGANNGGSFDNVSCMDKSRQRPVCYGFQNEQATSGSGSEADDGSMGGVGVVADTRTTVDSAADTVGLCRRLSGCLNPCQVLLRSCNRWSFTFIGMYGHSFFEAGERAMQLFEARGWTDVVEDPLIQNVLLMASVVIGGSTGVFAVVVEETDGFDFTSFHQPIITAFVIGSVLGYVLSNILLLGVVGSAVNTIIVCFAAGPFDFDKNHPRMSREMREVWSQHVVWEQASTPKTRPRRNSIRKKNKNMSGISSGAAIV